MRTLFVVPPNSAISAQDIQQYGQSDGFIDHFTGVTADLNEALDQLHKGQVDLVIEEPADAVTTIKNNQQATFTLYHHEIDPVQVSYINYLGWLYVGAVNQQVLYAFAVQGQKDAVTLHANLQEAHQNVSAIRQAVQSGDQALAQQNQLKLAGNVDTVSLAAGTSLGLLDSLQPTERHEPGNVDPVQAVVADLRQNTSQLGNSTDTKDDGWRVWIRSTRISLRWKPS